MLHRVRVMGYKSFRDCELPLGPVCVLVGPNASGKSNLFDGLRLLSSWVNTPSLSAAFEDHRGTPLEAYHRSQQTMGQMRDRDSVSMSFECDVELSERTVAGVEDAVRSASGRSDGPAISHSLLRYQVQVRLVPASGRLAVDDESLIALRRDGKPKASRAPFISREQVEGAGSEARLHLRREAGGHPYYHELGLDHTVVSEPLYPPHFAHTLAFRQELHGWRIHAFDPASIRAGTPWAAASPGHSGRGLAAYLHRLASEHPEELGRLTERLRRLVPFVDGLQVEANSDGSPQLRIVEQGIPVSARLASSGTLRLLALLAAVSPNAGSNLVCLEEPERSVHRKRLPILAETLREAAKSSGTQLLLSTHSLAFARLFENSAIRLCDRQGAATEFSEFDPAYEGLFRDAAIEEAIDSE